MNSTLKTTIIILVVVLLIGSLFRASGWRFGSSRTVVDDQYALDNGSTNGSAGASKAQSANSNNKNGVANARGSAANSNTSEPVPSDASLMALMNVARIRVPQTGVDVILNQGQADYADGAVKGQVALGRILGRIPTDSGYDVFVDMTVTRNNSAAVMHYVTLFRNVGQAVMFSSSVSIADRIILTDVGAEPAKLTPASNMQLYMVSATGYSLTVSYLDRKNGEPFTATPTLAKTVTLQVKNHILSK